MIASSTYVPSEGQPIHLTDAQRDDLEEIARSNALPAGFVQRAKIVLLLADGVSARAVETKYANPARRITHGVLSSRTVH